MMKRNRGRTLWKLSAYAAGGLLVLTLAVALFLAVFGRAILNGYAKTRIERAFEESRQGQTLRIGELQYALRGNQLVAQSVTMRSTSSTVTVDRMSLTGVRWPQLVCGSLPMADAFAAASLEATRLVAEFHNVEYEIRCERFQASGPSSVLVAEGCELWPLVEDEDFFATRPYRTTRYRLVLPECRISGLDYDSLLRGTSYRARSVQLLGPSFEALVNRDKPRAPFKRQDLMPHEALAAIRNPMRVDSLVVTNARLSYCERMVAGADPAVLTFGEVNLSANGIANGNDPSASVELRARGNLMDAGPMAVQMSIPIAPPDFSLQYSGSLGTMELLRLDPFLSISERMRVRSGRAREAAFEIHVTDGQARGYVHGIYDNLKIAVLDEKSGSESGVVNRAASLFINVVKVRNSNAPDTRGPTRVGEVNYTRQPEDKFIQYLWVALRSGVLDVISN
jgi:hypothetical protein